MQRKNESESRAGTRWLPGLHFYLSVCSIALGVDVDCVRRMKQVVEKMIASKKEGIPHPQITIFLYKSEQSEIIASFLQEMRRENSNLFNNRELFLELIMTRYNDIRSAP
jgi:hypothetical protein